MKKTAQTQCCGLSGSIQKLLILAVLVSISSNNAAFAFPWKASKPQGTPASPGTAEVKRVDDLKTQPANRPFGNGSEQIIKAPGELTVPILQSLARNPNDLPNLQMVSGRLLRGGQPSEAGLNLLKQSGVKTIIDLRAEEPREVEREKKTAERLGMKFIYIPMYTFERPDNKQFQQFLTTVASADNGPVYVHCLHGRDRTGTMVGAYRIMLENWTFDNAFKEMITCGFRPGFANLTRGLHDLAVTKGDKSPLPSASFVAADLKSRLLKYSKKHSQTSSEDNFVESK